MLAPDDPDAVVDPVPLDAEVDPPIPPEDEPDALAVEPLVPDEGLVVDAASPPPPVATGTVVHPTGPMTSGPMTSGPMMNGRPPQMRIVRSI